MEARSHGGTGDGVVPPDVQVCPQLVHLGLGQLRRATKREHVEERMSGY